MKRPLLVAFLLLVAGCGGGGSLAVDDAWGRSSPAVAEAAAFYVTVSNESGTGDRLLSAESERCGMTEIHVTEMDSDGIMRMRPADPTALALGDGERLEMAPGGVHVMCMRLTSPLVLGEEVPLTLTFERAGELTLGVSIEDR